MSLVRSTILCFCVGYEGGGLIFYSEPNKCEEGDVKNQCERILRHADLKSGGRKMISMFSDIHYYCLRHASATVTKALFFIIAVRAPAREDYVRKIYKEVEHFKRKFLSNKEENVVFSLPTLPLSQGPKTESTNTPPKISAPEKTAPEKTELSVISEKQALPKHPIHVRRKVEEAEQKIKVEKRLTAFKKRSSASIPTLMPEETDQEESLPFLKTKRRRTHTRSRVACVPCHKRKVRCKLNSQGKMRPCKNCERDGRIDCIDYVPVTKSRPPRKYSSKSNSRRPIKEKALADHLNRHRGMKCHRNPNCMRPYKHPGHCRTSNTTRKIPTAPPMQKALADHLNRHRGMACSRNPDCTRPHKHPGHCKIMKKGSANRSKAVKKGIRKCIPRPPIWKDVEHLSETDHAKEHRGKRLKAPKEEEANELEDAAQTLSVMLSMSAPPLKAP
uniref:Zn(2)-C6 fungal-type domain-containing protein n=1 Tax=Lotharella oceanica TaxID=641309 RepID=A0A7S2TK35_9EUKA